MQKLIFLGLFILELSKILLYETTYDKLQKYFGQDGIQIHYQYMDAYVMRNKTTDTVNDLDKLQDQYKVFDIRNLDKEHKFLIPGYLKIETPESLYIDKFVCFRNKCYADTTELVGNDNKLKGICKGYKKEISFDQYYKCLKNETNDRECKQFCIRSHDHEMYLQQTTKKIIEPFR